MNSEKVKEIKKALYCWQESVMLSTDENYVSHRVTNGEILDYINELEKEKAKLKQHKRELQGGQQDLTKRIAELEGEITKLDTINSKLEVDIELLNKQNIDLEIDRDYYQEQFNEQEDFYIEWNKQQLKQFAERLKGKFDEQKHFYEIASISHRDISLTALNGAYKYLDETLKEIISEEIND